jgi:hypothetical protein
VDEGKGRRLRTSVKLKALFSLVPVILSDSRAASEVYEHFLTDFEETKTVAIRGSFTHDRDALEAIGRPCTARERTRHFNKAPFLEVGDTLLEFSATLEFPGQDRFFATDPTGARIVQTEEQAIALWRSHLPHDLDLTIQSYFCALAIAYQGVVRPTGNVWIIDDSQYRADRYHLSAVHDSIEFLRQNRAIPEVDLEVDKVVQWTFAQNGMFQGYSDTPASRALNYFTRLFVNAFRNDELSDLVWALAGIEALLVEGGRSSTGQIREKLTALFGDSVDRLWLSKMIAASYDFRSRMIHGNRQLRSFFRSNEDESNKRFDEEYDSERFAIGMLVSLLRFVIARNLTEMNFRTVFIQ